MEGRGRHACVWNLTFQAGVSELCICEERNAACTSCDFNLKSAAFSTLTLRIFLLMLGVKYPPPPSSSLLFFSLSCLFFLQEVYLWKSWPAGVYDSHWAPTAGVFARTRTHINTQTWTQLALIAVHSTSFFAAAASVVTMETLFIT